MWPRLHAFRERGCRVEYVRAETSSTSKATSTQEISPLATLGRDDRVGGVVLYTHTSVIPSGTKWSRGIPFAHLYLHVGVSALGREDILAVAAEAHDTSLHERALSGEPDGGKARLVGSVRTPVERMSTIVASGVRP